MLPKPNNKYRRHPAAVEFAAFYRRHPAADTVLIIERSLVKHFGLVVLGLAVLLSTRLSFAAEKRVSFEREIQLLLERRCNKCHHPDDSRGGLDVTRLSTMLRGGDELGPAVIANNSVQSPLIQVLTGKAEPAMPSNATPLPPAEIELLSRWIKQGAIDDTTKFSVADITFFEKHIRPVLFQSCFKCHAGDAPESGLSLTSRHGILTGGNRGPAAIAGDPKQSLLITAIRHQGDLKMPRGGGALSATQIDAFEKWIRLKLPWPSDSRVLTREKQFTISQADRDHWAFRPLPESLSKDWSIDQILDTKHQQHQLSAIEQADRYRLLRRLSYDLIGYPPTPAEITAFNNDRPYDWFARVHIAGDRMPGPDGANYSIDQALAAAVPLNGDRTFQNAATDTFVLMDKLDEGIEFMGRSLLGVSLECARCHDHKFDPISQRDYYALLGIFKSSWFGPVSSTASTINAADASLARYLELQREAARLRGLIRQAGTAINIGGGGLVRKWQASRQAPLAPKEKRGVELEVLILRSERQQAIADAASKSLINEMKKTIATREASLKNFRARHFYVVAFKELGYEIHGHKTQVGLIERATQVGLNLVTKELQQLD